MAKRNIAATAVLGSGLDSRPMRGGTLLALLAGMLLGRGSLNLTSPGHLEPVVLVSSIAALRLRVERGYKLVPWVQALRGFDGSLSRNRSRVREFALAARVAGASLREHSDQRVLALIREHIRKGSLVGVQAAARDGEPASRETVARRQLVQAIAAQGRLERAGCRYRLVADVDLAMLPDRDRYEVVGRESAWHILAALATQPGLPATQVELLRQARDRLTPDWRPPAGEPNGLVLLRRVRTVAATAARCEPALTPSQWRALAAAGWIEIEFVDAQGHPVEVEARLELPDATRVAVRSDAEGVLAHRGFAPGLCRLALPALDAARWRPCV